MYIIHKYFILLHILINKKIFFVVTLERASCCSPTIFGRYTYFFLVLQFVFFVVLHLYVCLLIISIDNIYYILYCKMFINSNFYIVYLTPGVGNLLNHAGHIFFSNVYHGPIKKKILHIIYTNNCIAIIFDYFT
jgi:hypothetical protein